MIETDGDEQVVPNSPTIPYQEAFRTHLRVCERIEIALTVSGNYFCLPGEGRDPWFRHSELFKQL